MASSKQIRLLATNPAAMMRFQATGALPSGIRPESPLITLLESIGLRDLGSFVGVTVDERLGYAGSRTFANAAHALRWAKPDTEVFGSFPADTWRMKVFVTRLELCTLIECCDRAPSLKTERVRPRV